MGCSLLCFLLSVVATEIHCMLIKSFIAMVIWYRS